MATPQQYQEYLKIIADPDYIEKVAKLEFLNTDGTVAFTIDNNPSRSIMQTNRTRAWLQSGSLTVSLQNGMRRKASIEFANLDREFDFNVNHLWFGQQVRLSMGVKLKDGTDYYIPQGVFYISAPSLDWKPNSRKATYQLVDKWAYLDGSLFGKLRDTYEVAIGSNIFGAMQSILQISKYTLNANAVAPIQDQIDNITPIFTDYYNNLPPTTVNGQEYARNVVPYDLRTDYGQTYANVLLSLNKLISGWIGYNATGALTVEPSEAVIGDGDAYKPIQWDFTTASKTFLGLTETAQMSEVYNEVIVVGEALKDGENAPYAIGFNYDANSPTSIDRIGAKVYAENDSNYVTDDQCGDLARFRLRRAGALQKQVTITSTQMFHLQENNLISVKRTDKEGSPTERHLIQSFSIPIGQVGTMSITATSVQDFPEITVVTGKEIEQQEANQ